MEENKLFQRSITIEKVAAAFILAALGVVCLVYFSSFLQPLILALMVWYLIYELRVAGGRIRIRSRRLPMWLLTILAFTIVILVILGIVEIITYNLQLIRERSPVYLANLRIMLDNIQQFPGFELVQQRIVQRIESFDFNPILTALLNGISGMAGNIFLIIIYVAFLLAEQSMFAKKIGQVLGDPGRIQAFDRILSQVNSAVRTYVYVKTLMSFLTGILSYVVLLSFGVDFPVLWAFMIFLLNYVPYVGSFVATFLPASFAVFQFQSFYVFIWIFLAIQVVQILVGNVLEPKVMGKTLNLSPLGVLLALTFWGMIWGIMGMILSVPITSILVIIALRFPSTRFVAVLLSETGELPDH
jgi:predicted PurR-regulated permease PerM